MWGDAWPSRLHPCQLDGRYRASDRLQGAWRYGGSHRMWGDARSGDLHRYLRDGRYGGSRRLQAVWRYGGSHQMWGDARSGDLHQRLTAGPYDGCHRPRSAGPYGGFPRLPWDVLIGGTLRRHARQARGPGLARMAGAAYQWTEPGPHAASCRRPRYHGPHRCGQSGIPARRVRRAPADRGQRPLIRSFRLAVGSAAGPAPPRRPNVPALEYYRRRGCRSYGRHRPCRGPSAFRFPQPRQPTSSIYHNSIRTSEEGRSTVIGSDPLRNMSGGVLLSHTVPRAVPSALKSLTSGFGMGPGVSPSLLPPKLYGDITNLAHESEPYWRPYLGNRIVDA
jgi:hypothetical protein